VKLLEASQEAVYLADNKGFFPIHVAASVGSIGAVKCFLHNRPDTAGLRDAKGRTFLHVAVEKEMLKLVSFVCLTPSVDWILNMQDNDGNTALHLAIHARGFRMFCALLGNRKVNLNLTNNHWETALDLSRSKLPRAMAYGGVNTLSLSLSFSFSSSTIELNQMNHSCRIFPTHKFLPLSSYRTLILKYATPCGLFGQTKGSFAGI
jgi:ankyrin repeat protein